ncbi:MAG: hypothetical protein KJ737_22485 [Proteobacteria bacterium]|nr:hypothetical protein [Pseudomonadota bacterium]
MTIRAFFLVLLLAALYPVSVFPESGEANPKISQMAQATPFENQDTSGQDILKTGEASLRVQLAEYYANVPKNIVELQPFRTTTQIPVKDKYDQKGTATLINLNPEINVWFLLLLVWDNGAKEAFHLENRLPDKVLLSLNKTFPYGLVITDNQKDFFFDLWKNPRDNALLHAKRSGKPFQQICNMYLFLRNSVAGRKTNLEYVTDVLRNHVWQGDQIVSLVRETLYRDAYLISSEASPAQEVKQPRPPGAPERPLINPVFINYAQDIEELGIELDEKEKGRILIGRWYEVKGLEGIYISVVQPRFIAEEVIHSQRKLTNPLDEVESEAVSYMVAFDLDRFNVGFSVGTEHPKAGWSERTLEGVLDPGMPGPDGIDTFFPLVMTGMISPDNARMVNVAFIGGFKRYHSAFHYGTLALNNYGHHSGFIEYGTILSKLQPGLATIIVDADGQVNMKTWTETDNKNLKEIRHARQNGVPIIDYDPSTGISKPGEYVRFWGKGNWSGSISKKYRTLRAGLAVHENDGRRFLMFGYFSSVTTSAMARIFQGYKCKYAMLLDINALEHTYLSIYKKNNGSFSVMNLIKGMNVLDKVSDNQTIPRFIGFPDNRDFFYLTKKEEK